MTPSEYADILRQKIQELNTLNRPLLFGANACTAAIYERAFNDGYNTQGQQFQYKSDWYKRKREKRGFEVNFVDWTFEGDLKSDFANSPKIDRELPPKDAKPIKVSINEYKNQLSRVENQNKYKYLSVDFGQFLEPNKTEEALFYEIVEKELALMFSI